MATEVEYHVDVNWIGAEKAIYEQAPEGGLRVNGTSATTQQAPGPSGELEDLPKLAHRQSEHPVVIHIYNPPKELFAAGKLGKITGEEYRFGTIVDEEGHVEVIETVEKPGKDFVGEFEAPERVSEIGKILAKGPSRVSLTIAKGRFKEVLNILDITMSENPDGATDKNWVEFVDSVERGVVFGR